ncbi:MAG: hypothetical protein M3Q60_14925 [Actinomycetota bacterium]|nr:hypothetical protein [Actinomycetota bacterium]
MHGFHASLQKRIEALERRLGSLPQPETDAATNRRLELCRAALAGEIPEDLTATEKLTFEKITATLPVFLELRDQGIIDAYGQPSGGDDLDDLLDGDLDEPVWRP